jgi:hypothetical protein
MNVPDFISPVVGYRVWQWDNSGLKSLNGTHWLPGKIFVAECRIQGHEVPQLGCKCGIYAAKTVAHLRREGYDRKGIYGEVYLWGTVVEHQQGWRAQFAYPKNFVVRFEMLPFTMFRVESWLTTLATYGCDIFVHHVRGNVLLWRSGSGYDAAGLDLIMQQSKSWYARRGEECRIKPGDRVAVCGRGIAVVVTAGDTQVHAVLRNRSMLRIWRRDIRWDEQTKRWEAAVVVRTNKRCWKEINAHASL